MKITKARIKTNNILSHIIINVYENLLKYFAGISLEKLFTSFIDLFYDNFLYKVIDYVAVKLLRDPWIVSRIITPLLTLLPFCAFIPVIFGNGIFCLVVFTIPLWIGFVNDLFKFLDIIANVPITIVEFLYRFNIMQEKNIKKIQEGMAYFLAALDVFTNIVNLPSKILSAFKNIYQAKVGKNILQLFKNLKNITIFTPKRLLKEFREKYESIKERWYLDVWNNPCFKDGIYDDEDYCKDNIPHHPCWVDRAWLDKKDYQLCSMSKLSENDNVGSSNDHIPENGKIYLKINTNNDGWLDYVILDSLGERVDGIFYTSALQGSPRLQIEELSDEVKYKVLSDLLEVISKRSHVYKEIRDFRELFKLPVTDDQPAPSLAEKEQREQKIIHKRNSKLTGGLLFMFKPLDQHLTKYKLPNLGKKGIIKELTTGFDLTTIRSILFSAAEKPNPSKKPVPRAG